MSLLQSVQVPLLQQTIQKLESKMPDDLKDGYLRIVTAGQKLMFSKETHGYMVDYLKKITDPKQAPEMVLKGILKVMAILHRESQGKMMLPAAYPAAITLACYALEFLEKAGQVKVTPDLIARMGVYLKAEIIKLFRLEGKMGQSSGAPPTAQPAAQPAQPAQPAAPTPPLMMQGV